MLSFYLPFSSILGIPLQYVFGVTPTQQENQFMKDRQEEYALFPLKDTLYDQQGKALSSEEKQKNIEYNDTRNRQLMEYRDKHTRSFFAGAVIGHFGAPLSVLLVFVLFLFNKKRKKVLVVQEEPSYGHHWYLYIPFIQILVIGLFYSITFMIAAAFWDASPHISPLLEKLFFIIPLSIIFLLGVLPFFDLFNKKSNFKNFLMFLVSMSIPACIVYFVGWAEIFSLFSSFIAIS